MRARIKIVTSWLLAVACTIFVTPIGGEFFIHAAEDWGWYNAAGTKVGAGMSALSTIVSSLPFLLLLAFLVGTVATLWVNSWIIEREIRAGVFLTLGNQKRLASVCVKALVAAKRCTKLLTEHERTTWMPPNARNDGEVRFNIISFYLNHIQSDAQHVFDEAHRMNYIDNDARERLRTVVNFHCVQLIVSALDSLGQRILADFEEHGINTKKLRQEIDRRLNSLDSDSTYLSYIQALHKKHG